MVRLSPAGVCVSETLALIQCHFSGLKPSRVTSASKCSIGFAVTMAARFPTGVTSTTAHGMHPSSSFHFIRSGLTFERKPRPKDGPKNFGGKWNFINAFTLTKHELILGSPSSGAHCERRTLRMEGSDAIFWFLNDPSGLSLFPSEEEMPGSLRCDAMNAARSSLAACFMKPVMSAMACEQPTDSELSSESCVLSQARTLPGISLLCSQQEAKKPQPARYCIAGG
mmetsp:Transcript_2468/g.5350  ORF Transcript_2468/g.5350 Transcript_2468/m.5350 type:complete len:225 (+) Transcript_2468:792-1466(+)